MSPQWYRSGRCPGGTEEGPEGGREKGRMSRGQGCGGSSWASGSRQGAQTPGNEACQWPCGEMTVARPEPQPHGSPVQPKYSPRAGESSPELAERSFRKMGTQDRN